MKSIKKNQEVMEDEADLADEEMDLELELSDNLDLNE